MTDREPLDVLEAIHSTRAMRYLKTDPIPEDVLWAIIDAAIRGPNGSNMQSWGWMVIRDPELKQKLAEYYRNGWDVANRVDKRNREERFAIAKKNQLGYGGYLSVEYLAQNLENAPVFVIPVSIGRRGRGDGKSGRGVVSGGGIYGAVQNLQLAARAFGVGSTFTSVIPDEHAEDVRALLGMPDNAVDTCLIPLGYPNTEEEVVALGASPGQARFSEPRRLPVEQVTHWDRWGSHADRVDSDG